MFNRATLYILIAACAMGLGLWAAAARLQDHGDLDAVKTQAVRLFPQPRPLPEFSLRQSDGSQLTADELKHHWTLVFLGFTHCPDICPTTLAELARAQKHWETLPADNRPRVLFVSVDPERDTPDRAGAYARGFHRDTLAATADIPALEKFARSLSLVFAKAPPPPGAAPERYSVDHSAAIAVLDPQARMAGVISPPLDPQQIAADMALLSKRTER